MPELPEVETTRRGIAARPARASRHRRRGARAPAALAHRRELRIGHARSDRAPHRAARQIHLDHRSIRGTLILHLGMSGSLRMLAAAVPPRTHDHWDILLDSGQVLRFHDPRRFGSVHWTEADPQHASAAGQARPGAAECAVRRGISVSRHAQTRGRHQASHHELASWSSASGNIYASEALFRARISPRRAARRLSRAQAQALTQAIKQVLAEAIRIGGTTLRDYVNAEGTPGYFSQQLFVYERAGEPCRVCKQPVKQFMQGQRSTYWCSTCQR